MNGKANRIAASMASFTAFVSAVGAAEAPLPGDALQEIVVTAEKRAESVQSVPISMTTFGAAALEQKAIVNFFDYGTKVPNLAFAAVNEGIATSRTISIRGVNGNNTTGFYIDETPLPDSIDPRILDIDHIEVLRGPQGTLYGARSMGGTVRVITKAPELSQFSADVHAGLSNTWNTNRPNYTGDGVVNIPILEDQVALRVSGFYDTEAGFMERRYCTDPATAGVSCFPLTSTPSLTTTVKNVGESDSYGGAAALTIKISDALTITPRIMTQQAHYNGFPMSDYLSDPATYPRTGYPYPSPAAQIPALPTPVIPPVTPNNFVQGRFFDLSEGGHDTWNLYSVSLAWKSSVGELVSSTAYFDRSVAETEDTTDWLYASLLPLTSLPIGIPTNSLPGPIPSVFTNIYKYQRFVQEVRFVSALGGPVQFVAGAFYSDLHGRLPPIVGYDPPATAAGYGALLNGAYSGQGTCATIGLCTYPGNPNLLWTSDFTSQFREPSVFGEVSWQIQPELKATVGLRWSHVTTSTSGYEEGSIVQTPSPQPTVVSTNESERENKTTPKLQIDYHVQPDKMIYAVAAEGYRPGGIAQPLPQGLCGSFLPPGVTIADASHFRSDSLWNYELGAKTEWLDHRLTLNAAAFYIRWKDIQQAILLGCGIPYQSNAAAAVSKGGELELNARPIEPLQLSLGVGYENAKITQSIAASPQRPGDPVFQVPDWTGNASVSWTQALTDDWKLVGTGDYSYVGRSFSANNLTPLNGVFLTRERPSYRLLDARFALEHSLWEVALVGKNLTNEHANLSDSQSIAVEVPGRPRIVVNQPRTIGVEFREHF
jgi:iron complex outermembrane recepter protein